MPVRKSMSSLCSLSLSVVVEESFSVGRFADASEQESIFKWETLKEIGSHDIKLQYKTISGKVLEAELTNGEKVHLWRPVNGQEYFCHGLTFGGKEAPGGMVSLMGNDVPTILGGYYEAIQEIEVTAGDILVWHGAGASDEEESQP